LHYFKNFKKIIIFLFIILIFIPLSLNAESEPYPVSSNMHSVDNPIELVDLLQVHSADPRLITFTLFLSNLEQITSATLFYTLPNPAENQVDSMSDQDGIIQPTSQLSWGDFDSDYAYVVNVDTNKGTADSTFIPVGSLITYYWEFVDSNNFTYQTPSYEFVFLDGQYRWEVINNPSNVQLYYYGNRNTLVNKSYIEATKVIDDIASLIDFNLGFPIRIIYYRSNADAKFAVPPASSNYSNNTVTEGVRYKTDVVHTYTQRHQVLRHEVAHVITKIAGEGIFTSLPFWVDEGLAVYMSGDNAMYDRIESDIIQNERAFRVSSIQGKPGTPEMVDLFYAQSYSLTKYLIDENGIDKYRDFFSKLKADLGIEEALFSVYGLNQDTLYLDWREFHNMLPIQLDKLSTTTNKLELPDIVPLATPKRLKAQPATKINQNVSTQQNNTLDQRKSSVFSIMRDNILFILAGFIMSFTMYKLIRYLWKD
jgi:hypothetical protein